MCSIFATLAEELSRNRSSNMEPVGRSTCALRCLSMHFVSWGVQCAIKLLPISPRTKLYVAPLISQSRGLRWFITTDTLFSRSQANAALHFSSRS
eukprot:scaffold30450_cov46-Phaeocystis_antarctica.AAC.2